MRSASARRTLSAGLRMPAGSMAAANGGAGHCDARTTSIPRSPRCAAKKSGDMVMSIERSPRRAISAHTSSIPSIHGASATIWATSSAVRSAHSAWVCIAKSAAEISSAAKPRSSSPNGSSRSMRREISIAAVVPRNSVPSMSNTCRAVISSTISAAVVAARS